MLHDGNGHGNIDTDSINSVIQIHSDINRNMGNDKVENGHALLKESFLFSRNEVAFLSPSNISNAQTKEARDRIYSTYMYIWHSTNGLWSNIKQR